MNNILLKVVQGNLLKKEFSFSKRTTCVIGRALDCNILLPDDQAHSTISRYHCLLDINPPEICIRDFGSLNGTFVNGEKIGQRDVSADRLKANKLIYPEFNLKNNDEIKLGDTVLKVSIEQSAEKTLTESGSVGAVVDNDDPLDKINLLLGEAEKDNDQLISIRGYHITRELGKGSMGAVYLAKKTESEEQSLIALKVMLPKVETKPKAHQQFIREAKNTKLLKHKNIVQVYDIGCFNNTFFFTTDYCDSGTVSQLIRQQGGKLPLFQALKILIQVLDGLDFAHTVSVPHLVLANGKKTSATGLVHRDLKPGNLMLTRENNVLRVKIADFGLAKAFDVAGLSGRTATGISAGTPYYMPRQQIINFKYAKPEVDVWAAAATFYKMVTGRYARKYTSESDPWLTTLKTPVTPIRESEPAIPKDLADIIDQALVDQPEIYYKSAIDFKNDLLKVI